MPELLLMPEIAAATTSAVLAGWPVAVNTRFAASDVIATVETDKAVVDVEAEADGVILRTLVGEGVEVEVGTAIALLARPDETVEDVDAALAALGVSSGNGGAPAPVAAPAEAASAEAAPPASNGGSRRFASPLARRLAAESGLLVTDLVGTGPGGRIVRRDVEAALAQRVAHEEADVHDASPALLGAPAPALEVPTAVAPPEPRAAVPVPSTQEPSGYTDQPLSRMRKAVAARLTESKATAPHFYVRGVARVDALLQMRADLNDGADVRISVNDLIVKAVARAHQLVPEMNVVWTGEAIRSFSGVDVSVAVATDKGLVTPVLTSVESRTISDVARATQDFVARAREGRLQQSELEGGSVTVTNLGMYGVEEFAAIINPPQSAILAVGAAKQEAVVTDGRVEAATVLRVTLSVDHRPVDGAVAARWMSAFVSLLDRPVRILS
ncbi:dihydrolipoamide acetyltransferase family protein [Blastococcus sp. CT_GayMR16]|uniref:dihydrolipoamide acetyltransferase family protein n=1 Tax=Blastococcus sp. CT_GayMR16 TaxID=2559607 RepID=UPI001073949A|nr:dihydrolipoamide acetyltransferase family protein [Blastococcus sp. CT_GayMR16]TFV89608.1 2-oxo acid dehydrogenase subunit E2 [Blastococcus sp. CT_GayMR16]